MAKEQVSKSEQITADLSLVEDYDQPLRKRQDFLSAFQKALGSNVQIELFEKTKVLYTYTHDGIKEYFLAGAVTYLSNPHPKFKKRYQLKLWHKDFYNQHKSEDNSRIHLIGVYHYDGLFVFVEFKTEDYINRKLNSSAAHVYSNDIFQAVTNGFFEKVDFNGNHITALSVRRFKDYIVGNVEKNPIFDVFKHFNNSFDFNNWIRAIDAIREMRAYSWYQWKGAEWPGWYLEYRFNDYINKSNAQNIVCYIGNRKTKDLLDFDLFFPQQQFYGDLKASDITKKDAPGNDQENTLDAIMKTGKLWYVIYEHDTVKDIDRDSEMAIARMEEMGKKPVVVKGEIISINGISYQKKMKHSVNFKRMMIFELNRINMHEVLKDFNQGHQPDGSSRKPKFIINKRNINNYIVYSYTPTEQ